MVKKIWNFMLSGRLGEASFLSNQRIQLSVKMYVWKSPLSRDDI
jgi:hypothetical protein